MRLFRWQSIVHLCACAILMWTAVDLLVPQLCAAEVAPSATETSHNDDESPVRPEADCFCCSHTVSPVSIDVAMIVVNLAGFVTTSAIRLPLGVDRPLYHPPLQA